MTISLTFGVWLCGRVGSCIMSSLVNTDDNWLLRTTAFCFPSQYVSPSFVRAYTAVAILLYAVDIIPEDLKLDFGDRPSACMRHGCHS